MVALDSFDVVAGGWSGPRIDLRRFTVLNAGVDAAGLQWPQLEGRTVVATFRGRTAIALACTTLGLTAGDEVLVPAYNCGTEIDALIASGMRVTAYRVGPDAVIDFDDLVSRRTARTRAIYVIHYFGWEQPTKQLRRWCDDHDLKLIEDCALSLFSGGATGSLGRTGDAAIYSLPKTLGTRHGGLLSVIPRQLDAAPVLCHPGKGAMLAELRRALVGQIFAGSIGRRAKHAIVSRFRSETMAGDDEFPDIPKNYYFDAANDANRAAHPRLINAVAALAWQEIVRSRRENYLRLAERLKNIDGTHLLYPALPDGVCPLSLPLVVSSRDMLVRRLQNAGVESYPWWSGFHKGAINWKMYPDACQLKRSILTVPVYHGMAQLKELAKVVEGVVSISGAIDH